MSIWNQNGSVKIRIKELMRPKAEPFEVRLNHVEGNPNKQIRHFYASLGTGLLVWGGIIAVGFVLWASYGPMIAAMFRGLR